jgi:hypothetical protein
MFRSPTARIAACGGGLILLGCGILSQLDGWLGVGLWIVAAPIVCLAIELALRPKKKSRDAARTRPTLVVKLGPRRDSAPPKPARPKAAPPSPFVWHSQSRTRRRSR